MDVKAIKGEILAQIKNLKPQLIEKYAITQIGIFGSVARDEVHENSDIDVVVHMQPDLLKRVRLKAELEQVFARKVDVIRYRHSMNPYLKARIDREVIYV